MAYSTSDVVVGDLKKNEQGEVIRVSRVEYKSGNSAIDIRNYYTTEKGELSPTKKGVRVNSEGIPELMKLIYTAMSTEERMDFLDSINATVDDITG